jgi:hypothetical protein
MRSTWQAGMLNDESRFQLQDGLTFSAQLLGYRPVVSGHTVLSDLCQVKHPVDGCISVRSDHEGEAPRSSPNASARLHFRYVEPTWSFEYGLSTSPMGATVRSAP